MALLKGKKVLLAVGGTGGHVFPAQALAVELLEKGCVNVFFAGAGLNSNRFLDKNKFPFQEVISATPFRKNALSACFILLKGIKESVKLVRREKPDLMVGFGSYHSFPLLAAAKLLGIPIVLFEADTIPGKVNRLFSRFALFTAVHFPHTQKYLKGKTIPVAMPSRHRKTFEAMTQEEARKHLGLDPHRLTLFVFGGSQGSLSINCQIPQLLRRLKDAGFSVQLMHVTGNKETSSHVREACKDLDMPCYVKEFESHMGYLWTAATCVIARSGASTLSEMISFEVPGILVPYPHASDAHQHFNAEFFAHEIKGGICLLEADLSVETLCSAWLRCEQQLDAFKEALRLYKSAHTQETLGKMVYALIS